jgi:ATP-dependent DNA helicase RecQ
MRGECGTEKPMSCSASLLAKIAELKPRDAVSMNRILGDRRAERFGSAFLEVIAAQ